MWSLWKTFYRIFSEKTFVPTILAVSVLLRKVERHSLGDRMEPGALKDDAFIRLAGEYYFLVLPNT